MSIDIGATEVLVFGHVVAQWVQVDDNDTDRAPHLRSGQSDALAFCQRVPHVTKEFVQLRIVGRNVLGYLAEHRLTIYINR